MAVELVAHIAAFVRILNSTQTAELHQWDATSFERACAWSATIKQLAEKAEGEHAYQLNEAITQQLNGAHLPIGGGLSAEQLRAGPRLVCEAILTSPHLHSHPQRQKVVQMVMARLRGLNQDANDDVSRKDAVSSDLFVSRVAATRRREQVDCVAREVAGSFKHARVQIHSHILEIPSLKSYVLSRRPMRLRSLATTLLANIRVSNALNADKYRELLDRIGQQLQVGDKDVLEVIVWCIVDHSAEMSSNVYKDLLQLVEKQLEVKQHPVLLRSLDPWLAALFARQSSPFASSYIVALVHHSILYLDKEELHTRLGSTALQGDNVASLLETQLGRLDAVSIEQLLS